MGPGAGAAGEGEGGGSGQQGPGLRASVLPREARPRSLLLRHQEACSLPPGQTCRAARPGGSAEGAAPCWKCTPRGPSTPPSTEEALGEPEALLQQEVGWPHFPPSCHLSLWVMLTQGMLGRARGWRVTSCPIWATHKIPTEFGMLLFHASVTFPCRVGSDDEPLPPSNPERPAGLPPGESGPSGHTVLPTAEQAGLSPGWARATSPDHRLGDVCLSAPKTGGTLANLTPGSWPSSGSSDGNRRALCEPPPRLPAGPPRCCRGRAG